MSEPRVINMPRVEQAVIRQGPDTWAVTGPGEVAEIDVTQVLDTDWTDDPTTPVVGQQLVYTADGEAVRR